MMRLLDRFMLWFATAGMRDIFPTRKPVTFAPDLEPHKVYDEPHLTAHLRDQ